MGIPVHLLPPHIRAACGLSIPTKPARAKRGTGAYSMAKARLTAAVVEVPRGTREVTIPIRTVSEANNRDNHWKKAARQKRIREVVGLFVGRMSLPAMPVRVTMVRIGKRLLDDDNLRGSLKAVRDQIAATFGVDDASKKYDWVYGQEIGEEYGVRVTLESR